jgi:hypothetical protein
MEFDIKYIVVLMQILSMSNKLCSCAFNVGVIDWWNTGIEQVQYVLK